MGRNLTTDRAMTAPKADTAIEDVVFRQLQSLRRSEWKRVHNLSRQLVLLDEQLADVHLLLPVVEVRFFDLSHQSHRSKSIPAETWLNLVSSVMMEPVGRDRNPSHSEDVRRDCGDQRGHDEIEPQPSRGDDLRSAGGPLRQSRYAPDQ